jgi:DNA (cytosine-5)-methyltransferase 1
VKVVDLFCGMGGLSLGFVRSSLGFEVQGFDANKHAVATYQQNVGPAQLWDMTKLLQAIEGSAPFADALPHVHPEILIGGPPCRPWSAMNLQRRGEAHPDYHLVRAFQLAVLYYGPRVFVLENVPILGGDETFRALLDSQFLRLNYDVKADTVRYSEWGAATRRRRLFAIGVQKWTGVEAADVFAQLERLKQPEQTLMDVMMQYADLDEGAARDHEWPKYTTISKYADKYASNRYGWYLLDWGASAPSFGNVGKTYVLHPNSINGNSRVVSPREILAILGFGGEDDYSFPPSVPRTAKYRMVADAVSPVFGEALARAIHEVVS